MVELLAAEVRPGRGARTTAGQVRDPSLLEDIVTLLAGRPACDNPAQAWRTHRRPCPEAHRSPQRLSAERISGMVADRDRGVLDKAIARGILSWTI